jgi:hypothetical protein
VLALALGASIVSAVLFGCFPAPKLAAPPRARDWKRRARREHES